MNTHLFSATLLAAAIAHAQPAAPDAAPAKSANPPAAPAGAPTEMQKWIETTDAPWQATFKRDVSDVHETELNKVKQQYLTSLDDAIKKASGANDLKGALALRDERKRFEGTQVVPERDEAGDAPVVKAIRAVMRAQLGQAEARSAARAKALLAKYDQLLLQAQTQLTKAQRLDDAQLVQNKRDEVAAAWITPAVATASAKTDQPITPPPAAVQTATGSLQERLSNSAWAWNPQETITLLPSGMAKWSFDNSESFTWHVTSETDRVVEGKTSKGANFKLTFDAGLQTAKLWEGGQGERLSRRAPAAGAAASVIPAAPVAEAGGANLFKNPNFENGTEGWELDPFGKNGTMTVDTKELHNGKPSLRIECAEGGLTFVRQRVEAKPNTHYQLSGYIRTSGVEPLKKGSQEGACLMVGFSAEVRVWPGQPKASAGKSAAMQKTKQWTKITVDFNTSSKTTLPVGAALGYYNEEAKGTAWFAELSLTELGSRAKK